MSHALTTWKEIAHYLGKGLRTAQRYEQQLGLPVRRPKRHRKGVVLAFAEEIDGWMQAQLTTNAANLSAELTELRREVSVLREENQSLKRKLLKITQAGGRVRKQQADKQDECL